MSLHIDKLKGHVQKIFPAVYDDSLSYYELLSKIMSKLDEIIDDVNDYFGENIEVHVSKIILEMKENGELESIINESIFTDLNNKINEIDSRNESELERLENKIDRFGLVVQADENTEDWSIPIQEAINIVHSNGGGGVVIPAGTHEIKQTIILKENVHLRGVGHSSIIKMADNTSMEAMIKTEYNTRKYTFGIEISDLQLNGNRTEVTGITHGIVITNGWQSKTKNVKIQDMTGDGIQILGKGYSQTEGSSTNFVSNSLVCYNNGNGILVDSLMAEDNSGYSLQGDFHSVDNDIGHNGLAGIVLRRGDANAVRNCVTWMNGQLTSSQSSMCGVAILEGSNINEITNNNLEGNKGNGIYIMSNHNSVIGNRIFANSQEQDFKYYGVHIGVGKGNLISSNKLLSGIGVAGQQRVIYNGGTHTELYNNSVRWNNYGNASYAYQPVVNSDIANASVVNDQSYIQTNIYGETAGNNVATSEGVNVNFNTNEVDSFDEFDGFVFYPKFDGKYMCTGTVYMEGGSGVVTIQALGKTIFMDTITGSKSINFMSIVDMKQGQTAPAIRVVGNVTVIAPTNIIIKKG